MIDETKLKITRLALLNEPPIMPKPELAEELIRLARLGLWAEKYGIEALRRSRAILDDKRVLYDDYDGECNDDAVIEQLSLIDQALEKLPKD
jgi:hypothetical protein